jgi:hypothetical protein
VKRDYLGDSYDAVKRLWQQITLDWAPLYAEPVFVPDDLRADFTLVTLVPILPPHLHHPHSLLNDPDTGIPSPRSARQRTSRTHAPLQFITEQLGRPAVRCVITFDQSHHRLAGAPPAEQRAEKLSWLHDRGHAALYFVSHAPFLFACSSASDLAEVESLLLGAGIPECRLQHVVA